MRKNLPAWTAVALMILLPWHIALWPYAWRVDASLFVTPFLWGLSGWMLLPKDAAGNWPGLFGRRRVWPFVWVPALMALCLPFLGLGYVWNLVVFSYGLTRPASVQAFLLPAFAMLAVLMTLGVEKPLREGVMRKCLWEKGMSLWGALGLSAGLGALRALPLYVLNAYDARYVAFALLHVFIFEFTLSRLYAVTLNLAACGVYHAAMMIFHAFLLSDVLSPYLPSFHWISSSLAFYWLITFFMLLPAAALYLARPCRPVLQSQS